tara:strand:+ start:193 stop:624 length:432 start_codon:yes stop_codon:yes gene_type:complete
MTTKEETSPEDRGSMADKDQGYSYTPGLEEVYVEPQRGQPKNIIEQMIDLQPQANNFIPKTYLNNDAERHMLVRMFAENSAVTEGEVDFELLVYLDFNLRVAVKGRGRSEVVEMVTKERPNGQEGFMPKSRRSYQPQEGGNSA